MTGEDFAALFDSFAHSAFRLETLQTYSVPAEDPGMRAFREGGPHPERSVRTSPWLHRIAVTTASGKDWSRVRVVAYPLSEYTRYEVLVGYRDSQPVGERITLVGQHEVGDLGPDFWLFDADTDHARAVIMHYTPGGQVDRYEHVGDPVGLEELRRRRELAESRAVPLNVFLAHTDFG